MSRKKSSEQSIEELERKLIRIQQSSGTRWPRFLRLHNWMRMHSRIYYHWHTSVAANPVHVSLITIFVIAAAFFAIATILVVLSYMAITNYEGFDMVWRVLTGWWDSVMS